MKTLANKNLKVWENYGKTRYYINGVTSDSKCFIEVSNGMAKLILPYMGRGLDEDMAYDRLEEIIGTELLNAFLGGREITVEKLEELAK
jgi:hypothetical protein